MNGISNSKRNILFKYKLIGILAIVLVSLIITTCYIISRDSYSLDPMPTIEANTNPTWYEDFDYVLNEDDHTINLVKYNGSVTTDYSVPAQ